MKYFTLIAMLFSMSSFASEAVCTDQTSQEDAIESKLITTDVPNFLKGAKITVTLANGKSTSVPAEQFKVVPRKRQEIVTKTRVTSVTTCNTTTNIPRKNRVSLVGGHGAKEGLNSSQVGNHVEVESNVGLVGGAQYQRMLNNRWSLGIQGQTNKTGSLLLGIDF